MFQSPRPGLNCFRVLVESAHDARRSPQSHVLISCLVSSAVSAHAPSAVVDDLVAPRACCTAPCAHSNIHRIAFDRRGSELLFSCPYRVPLDVIVVTSTSRSNLPSSLRKVVAARRVGLGSYRVLRRQAPSYFGEGGHFPSRFLVARLEFESTSRIMPIDSIVLDRSATGRLTFLRLQELGVLTCCDMFQQSSTFVTQTNAVHSHLLRSRSHTAHPPHCAPGRTRTRLRARPLRHGDITRCGIARYPNRARCIPLDRGQ
ncbi:hypothetical protein BKA93DRAFT_2333 [Sparassis latifolia]